MRKNLPIILAIVVLAAVPAVRGAAELYLQWLWFIEVGYQKVFLTMFFTGMELGVVAGVILFLLLLINFIVANRITKYTVLVQSVEMIEMPGRDVLQPYMRLIFLLASLFLSVVMGIEVSSRWALYLQYLKAAPFGMDDPLFAKDAAFYIFRLPALIYANQALMAALIFATILSAAVYVYKNGFGISPKGIHVHRPVYAHLSVLLALLLLAKGFGYFLMRYQLLVTQRSIIHGAGYTDVHLRLPFLNVLIVVAIVAAVVLLANTIIRHWLPPVIAVVLVAVVSGLGVGLPSLFQQLRVAPNEIVMERPYLERQIKFTRVAYNLNKIVEKEVDLGLEVASEDVAGNPLTIRNIRLWDPRPLLSTYRQLQEIRTYYHFGGVDIDRYDVNGQYTQVMLSPRELAYEKLPAKIWINEHLTYTHGYGLCMSPVNLMTPEGLPEFYIKDIPPISNIDIKIERPEIYFGEFPNEYVFVKTNAKEFDYPLGKQNEYTTYGGRAGIPVSSLWRRLALAIRFASISILLNTDISSDSSVLINRGIPHRAMKAMPFVNYDPDPYLVVHEGRLVWLLDGYTYTGSFPYSEPLGEFNYVRNSVKTVVDAYDGTIKMYVIEPDDPIIQTYSRIFPGTFLPIEEMPSELRRHLRYPQWLFRVQAELYRTYQMTDPQVFYNKEDMWAIPMEVFYTEEQEVESYYTIMKLPGEEREEFILMLPYTPFKRDNLSAWMCARIDAPHYGELLVYKFPKDKLFYGPLQIEARVDQDPEISKQFSLWGQKGSEIIRGNLLVIPLGSALLYVEPIYLQAEKGKIPELKRVIVAAGNKVVMEETLDRALRGLVSAGGITVAAPDGTDVPVKKLDDLPEDVRERLERANEHFQSARRKLEEGDWEGFGSEMEKLERLLRMGE